MRRPSIAVAAAATLPTSPLQVHAMLQARVRGILPAIAAGAPSQTIVTFRDHNLVVRRVHLQLTAADATAAGFLLPFQQDVLLTLYRQTHRDYDPAKAKRNVSTQAKIILKGIKNKKGEVRIPSCPALLPSTSAYGAGPSLPHLYALVVLILRCACPQMYSSIGAWGIGLNFNFNGEIFCLPKFIEMVQRPEEEEAALHQQRLARYAEARRDDVWLARLSWSAGALWQPVQQPMQLHSAPAGPAAMSRVLLARAALLREFVNAAPSVDVGLVARACRACAALVGAAAADEDGHCIRRRIE